MYGLAAAAAIAVATPAAAQVGFYAGPGGAGVEIGTSHGWHRDHYRWDRGRHEGWARGRHEGYDHRYGYRDHHEW
jgi:hypothetical protein